MTTLLQHVFDFTDDDLAANQNGELSKAQLPFKKIETEGHVIIVPDIGAGDFTLFGTDVDGSLPLYEYNHNDVRLVIDGLEILALEHGIVYDFYCWSILSPYYDDSNPVLSVNFKNGNPRILCDLEATFNFLEEDLISNRKGRMTDRQVWLCEMFVATSPLLNNLDLKLRMTLGIVAGGVLLLIGLGSDRLAIVVISLAIIAMTLVNSWIRYTSRLPLKQHIHDLISARRVDVMRNVKKSEFELSTKPTEFKHYFVERDGARIGAYTHEFETLEDDAVYHFYYFPEHPPESDNHLILAVEPC